MAASAPPPAPPGPPPDRLRELLGQAVAAGILTADQAAAVTALQARPAGRPPGRRGAVLAEVLGYVGGSLAVAAALFLGTDLWDELGPWPRVLLLAAVAVAALLGGAALDRRGSGRDGGSDSGRDGASGRLGGFLWAVAVVGAAAAAGVGTDGLLRAEPGTSGLVAASVALVVAALLWWARPAVLQHVAAFGAAVVLLLALLDRLGDGASGWGGPALWGLGLVWLAASALPVRAAAVVGDDGPRGGVWRPAEPGWVLSTLAVVTGPLFADAARPAWLVVGVASAAALVVVGVRTRRSWVAAIGTGGVFLGLPLAVSELFDARLGPLVAVLVVGSALVAAAVVLTRRAAR